jgi:hypothetical protein
MEKRASTRETQAVQAGAAWTDAWGGVGLVYKRIDPGYRSQGAYYFNNDLENVTIEPRVKLARGRVRVAGSLGFQHDNLKDAKDLQTTRTIGSARLDWTPSSLYTANLAYSNYSLDQKAGRSPLDSTSTKIAQSTSNVSVTQALTVVGARTVHGALLLWSRQDMEDRTTGGNLDASYTADQVNASYTFTWVPWGLGLTAGYNRSTYDADAANTAVAGPTLGANLAFWQHKASVGVSGALSNTSVDDLATVRTTVLQVQGALRPQRRHRFTVRFSVHHDEARSAGATTSTETRGEIGYAYTF